MLSGMIRSLKDSDVKRICSEQSVTTLSLALKELVENSLDAGTTSLGELVFEK